MANGKDSKPADTVATAAAPKKERKKKTPVPENETPAQKFVRLGVARTLKAAAAISNVGRLTGRGYESTPEQRAKIVKQLSDALETAKTRLNGESLASGADFTL